MQGCGVASTPGETKQTWVQERQLQCPREGHRLMGSPGRPRASPASLENSEPPCTKGTGFVWLGSGSRVVTAEQKTRR